MKSPLQKELRRCFPYLFNQCGFEFVVVGDNFGGKIAIAQSGKMRIRFIQDRADFFLDIGSTLEPEQWIGFYKILDQLRASGLVTDEYKYSNRMKVISNLLNRYFSTVRDWIFKEDKRLKF